MFENGGRSPPEGAKETSLKKVNKESQLMQLCRLAFLLGFINAESRCFPRLISYSEIYIARNESSHMHYVYILRCADELTYVGCTSDLRERFQRHIKGQVPATALRLPVSLIFYAAFKDKYKAYDFEKYLKTGSGWGIY